MLPLAIALAVLIGVSLGLLGGGGSILTTPVLLYALSMEPKEAIATSLLVVGVTSIAGLVQHARLGNVDWRIGALFGVAGMGGAFLGGYAAQWVPAKALLVLFALLMLGTAAAMFRGRAEVESSHSGPLPVPVVLAEGLLVGAVTGLVGAGGGFLVVPALALHGRLPMQRAIGTSLLVIALKSFAGFAGHAAHVHIDLPLALGLSGAAVLGSVLGSRLAARLPAQALRKSFAGLVLVMGTFVLVQQL